MLPGNWLIVGFAALYAATVNEGAAQGITWEVVTALVVIAALGEVAEFMAGAAGAAKKGGSRRSVVLAIVGAVAGSFFGAVAGLPIPLIGPLVGALAGAGFGAFAGAYLGRGLEGPLPWRRHERRRGRHGRPRARHGGQARRRRRHARRAGRQRLRVTRRP